MPISYIQGSNKYYLHYDQVGSLKAVTDNNHNIIKEIAYDSFGNILSDSNPSIKVPFGFAGGLYDKDTKLLRFGYRDYDSYTGKWTAKDPIDFDGDGYNLYGYVLNDPVNFVDVTGEFLVIPAVPFLVDSFVVGIGLSIYLWQENVYKPTGNNCDIFSNIYYNESTPTTNPEDFDSIKNKKAKRNKKTGEFWEPDMLHKDHWEVYKNRKKYDKGRRDRSVWNDGRLKDKFK